MSSTGRERPFFVAEDDPPSKVAILKAALRLFVAHGREATTVRAIAEAAGYTNPALFKFFASKDELATHLFARCYERLSDRLHEAIAPHPDFAARTAALVASYTRMLGVRPEADALLYVNDALRDLWPAVRRRLGRKSIVALVRRLVIEGRGEGAVAADVGVDVLVAAFLGVLAQFARQHAFRDLPGPPERYAPDLTTVIARMCAQGDSP